MVVGVEPRVKVRWGLIFAVANAGGGTGLGLYLLEDWLNDPFRGGSGDPSWPVVAMICSGIVLAWLGVWAWYRKRWAIAAPALLFSLAMPWGYFVEISAPIVLGLATVAGVRGFRQRRRRSRGPGSRGGLGLAEFGSAGIGIAAGVALAAIRGFNGQDYDRSLLPTLAFGALIAAPGVLALMAMRRRPALYLAAAILYVPISFLSMAGITLPLLFVGAMALVAHSRHGDESLTVVPAPLTAIVLLIINVATWGAMVFNGSDDPRCSSTATSTTCTSDIVTTSEALLGLAGVALILAAGWYLSRPRQGGAAA